jgi:hypothetical protein
MRSGVAQNGIIRPVLFSLYVNDIPSLSRHVELALYADDTTVIATSRQPALIVRYLETYLSDLERWLSKRRIAIYAKPSQAKVLTGGGDLLEAQVDVPLSASHSCV